MELVLIDKREKTEGDRHMVRTDYSVGVYAVTVFDTTYSDGEARREISCRCLQRGRSYFPEIYYRSGRFEDEAKGFEIQTTSYGAINVSEFRSFLEAQQMALDVVDVLNRELNLSAVAD